MLKLVQFELKKILKSKLNLILLIAAIAIQCLALKEIVLSLGYLNYYINQDEAVNQIEYKQYLDEFYAQHQGIVNDEYINEWNDEYYDKLVEILDKEKMIQIYGDNYEEMIIAGKNGSLSEEEMWEYIHFVEERSQRFGYDYAPIEYPDDGSAQFTLNLYYKSGMEGYAYNLHNIYFDSDYWNNDKNIYLDVLNQSKENKIIASQIDGKTEIEDFGYIDTLGYFNPQLISQMNMNQINWLNEKYENVSSQMDTTIGAGVLIQSFDVYVIYVIYLLVFIVIGTDLFAGEKNKKIDALLSCAKEYKRITTAKIITMLLLVISVFILASMINVLVVSLFFDIKNLHLASYGFSLGNFGYIFILYSCIEILVRQMGLVFCSFLCVAGLSVFLSCLTKNRFVSAIIMIIFVVFPILMTNGHLWLAIMPLTMLMGHTYFSFSSGVAGYLLPIVDLGGTIVHTATLVCLFWIIVSIILMIGCYVKQRKHIVR